MLELQRDELLAHPLVHPRQGGQRVGELGRGRGRGDPREAGEARDHRAGDILLIHDEHVRLERVRDRRQRGDGGPHVGDEEALPEELERRRAAQSGSLSLHVFERRLVEVADHRQERRAGREQWVDDGREAGPGHHVPSAPTAPRRG